MARYAAFLRAVNVGARWVKSEDLRACFDELGFTDVATFRTSGNVVFSTGGEAATKIASRVEKRLAKATGFDVPVYLRTAPKMKAIAAYEPFPARMVASSKGKLQVSLLVKRPSAAAAKKVLALATDEDRLAIRDQELYWLPSGGLMDSDLDLRAIENLLGPTTKRTKGTLDQLAAKYF